jgi:diguanylate cyclase (GGDEF)-like protein/PAS domain S-box-containing protein
MLHPQAQTTPPQPHQPEAMDLAHDVLDQTHDDCRDINTLETALASLLVRHPEAPVIAAGADGVLVPMPASVPLQHNPVLEARTGMDLVSPSDRGLMLATWDKVLTGGAARCVLHLASNPDATITCSWFDVRETHGVIVTVLVPTDAANSPVPQVPERPPVTSRFARISKDDAGVIVKIDEAVTQILGWSAEEMEGHRSTEFFHPDDHALAIDNWLEMLASPGIGRRVRLRHSRRDGSWVWFEITNNNLLEDPDYRCVVCEMVDISEEMAREQLLGRLAETVPVGLFQVDADRHIIYTNDRLHQILGVEGATTVETQLATVVEADQPALERALNDVLGQGEDADIEVELQLPPSGTLRFCTISLRALTHGDGTISGAIACVADVTDSTRMREELKKRATFDELTACYNRPSIMDALEASVASGQRRGERAVMFIDLDRFKDVNDRDGHAAGDELLRIVAEGLRSVVRADDLVGRIGGDEFLVVCPEIGGAEQAMKLAGRIAQALRKQLCLATVSTASQLQASIGVAWSNGDGIGADTLVAQADNAMYESKHERNGQPKLATADPEIPARRLRPTRLHARTRNSLRPP